MARVIPKEENGRWIVLVDVDQYGGDELSIAQARSFGKAVLDAAVEAKLNNARDNA